MPRVEVIRGPEVHSKPMITVQRREDEETFAMSIEEAHRFLEVEQMGLSPDCSGSESCLFCMVTDALEGIR